MDLSRTARYSADRRSEAGFEAATATATRGEREESAMVLMAQLGRRVEDGTTTEEDEEEEERRTLGRHMSGTSQYTKVTRLLLTLSSSVVFILKTRPLPKQYCC
jgi:hypothetical protein